MFFMCDLKGAGLGSRPFFVHLCKCCVNVIMITIFSDTTEFYVDLRGLPTSAILTGTLRNNYVITHTAALDVVSQNDRATKFNATFFNDVERGDYSFEIINSQNEVIYRERVQLRGDEVIEHETNEIEFLTKTHNP